MNGNYEVFMARIKKLRQERGWDQVQLAGKLGTSKSTISMYESGQRRPGYNMLCKMVDLFDESADYIMGLTDVRRVKKIAQ